MIEQCPNPQEDCQWFDRPVPKALQGTQEHGCYSDCDHIIPRRWRTLGTLVRLFIETPENKRQMCRREHDDKPMETYDMIPTEQDMLDAVLRSMERGDMRLNNRDRTHLEQIRQELGECYE